MTSHPKELLSSLKERTNGSLEVFLLDHHICSECAGDLAQVDGKFVCQICGMVSQRELDSSNPFSDHHCSPVNELAFNRNLGGTLQTKGLWCVLAHGPQGNTDLPIRARQISVITEVDEHPKVRSMLRLASGLSNKYGFSNHDDRKCIYFSNMLGGIIRTVGAYVACHGDLWSGKIVRACFLLAFEYSALVPPEKMVKSLGVSPELYVAVSQLYERLRPLLRPLKK